ncbi:hypothetical protein [Tumebacillus permanentifrigoris]|uniref:Spore germination protein GerPA/GerPF n=1 Tax=Tumebacillus permanentifrigoris TaxID=378543 RepID=A0A316D5J4_9BACL|nr:hypothetical protein [Tumebacillus permanentifrigoris]PWK08480.1 spore germination protein GerPA/GerPF [Tumebacillus permanentifrigoris]
MQIQLGNLKVNTVDRSFVNIGPSVKVRLRASARINQGQGEIVGDHNVSQGMHLVNDRDVVDTAYWSKRVQVRRG